MTAKTETSVRQIAGLSREEQATIAADILLRLHETDAAGTRAWEKEAGRRLEEIKAGAETHDAMDVLAEARQRLRDGR